MEHPDTVLVNFQCPVSASAFLEGNFDKAAPDEGTAALLSSPVMDYTYSCMFEDALIFVRDQAPPLCCRTCTHTHSGVQGREGFFFFVLTKKTRFSCQNTFLDRYFRGLHG